MNFREGREQYFNPEYFNPELEKLKNLEGYEKWEKSNCEKRMELLLTRMEGNENPLIKVEKIFFETLREIERVREIFESFRSGSKKKTSKKEEEDFHPLREIVKEIAERLERGK